MSALSIAGILAAVSSIGFGIFVYAHNPRRPLYRIWFVFTFSVALWGLGAFFISIAHDAPLSYIAWRLSFGLGVVWIAPLFLDFATIFCEIKDRSLVRAAYFSAAVFSVCAIETPYFFAGVRPFADFLYGVPDFWLFGPFMAWWFGLIIWAHYLLIRAYPHSSEPKRLQIRYFFLATAFGYCTGSLAYLPFFHVDLYPWGTFGIAVYPLIMSYATVEYQLLDINLAARRALISSVTVAVIAFGLLLSGIGSSWITAHLGIPPIVIAFFGALVAFVLGNEFWQRTKKFDQLRYEFIAVAAHKLRTPLTEIRWAAGELQQVNGAEEARAIGADIMSSSTRMLDLVNALLQSVQVDDESYAYKFGLCDLREITERVLLEHKVSLERKHLHSSFKSEVEKPIVYGDAMKLLGVVQIYLENAILYTPENGTIAITIGSHNNDFLIFRVSDTGIGIEKKDLEHLFTRLYRGSNALLTSTEGSGLGLFMAKEIIQRHKGMVGADSDGADKGAAFWFIIPKAG